VSPPQPSTEQDPRPRGEQEAHPLLTHRAPTEKEEDQEPTTRALLRVLPESKPSTEITAPITPQGRPTLRVIRGGPQVQIRSLREVRLCYPNGTELPVHWRLDEGAGPGARWFIGADLPAGTRVQTGMTIRAATQVLPVALDVEPTVEDWIRGGARA